MLIISGCAVQNSLEYREIRYDIDLTKYNNRGLYLTTGDYSGEYVPIALVQSYCQSGLISADATHPRFEDDTYRSQPKSQLRTCKIEQLLDDIVEDAENKGANGIILLKIETDITINNGLEQEIIKITGLAIDRQK